MRIIIAGMLVVTGLWLAAGGEFASAIIAWILAWMLTAPRQRVS